VTEKTRMADPAHALMNTDPRLSPKTRVWASSHNYDRNLQDCCG
jgi:hypothetical protein